MEEAQRLADRIVILQAGAIAAQGTAEQLSRALGHGTRIGFLAPPRISPAQVSAAVGAPVEQDGRRLGFRSDQARRDLTALPGWAAEHGIEFGPFVTLILGFVSGVFIPVSMMPSWMLDVGRLFPLEHLARGLQQAFAVPGSTGITGIDLAVITAWGAGKVGTGRWAAAG